MQGFAGFSNFQPFNQAPVQTAINQPGSASSFSTDSASFKVSSTDFVPKKKQQVGADYPALGEEGKVTTSAPKKDEDEDPCKGKPKEFFIYDLDQVTNTCIYSFEQLTFVSIHYPEYYHTAIDILMWLYDMAEYRDLLKFSAQARSKKTGGKKGKGRSAQARDESSEEEYDMQDSTFGQIKSVKDLKKIGAKKPAIKPSLPPVLGSGKQMTEEQKEEARKKKLQQMQKEKDKA